LGGYSAVKNDEFARSTLPVIEPMMAVGFLKVASDRVYFENLTEIKLPAGVVSGRRFN